MTTSSDLRLSSNVERRLFARIEGINYDFWQPNNTSAPTTTGYRTSLECFEMAGGGSLGVDLKTLKTSPSVATLKLYNIFDDNANRVYSANNSNINYLLPNLFGTRKIGATTFLTRASWDEPFLHASDTTINTGDTSNFPSSGIAYIGSTAFTYTGKTINSFTGCKIGVYPISSETNFAKSIYILDEDDPAYQGGVAITQYPQTHIGRKVVVRVATKKADDSWSAYSDTKILFVGSISDTIIYDAEQGCFQLSCENILQNLENKVGLDRRISVSGYNLSGSEAVKMNVKAYLREQSGINPSTTTRADFDVSIDQNHYTLDELAKAVNEAINDGLVSNSIDVEVIIRKGNSQTLGSGGENDILAFIRSTSDDAKNYYIQIGQSSSSSEPCHPILALTQQFALLLNSKDQKSKDFTSYPNYQPLSYAANGGYIYLDELKGNIPSNMDNQVGVLKMKNAYNADLQKGDENTANPILLYDFDTATLVYDSDSKPITRLTLHQNIQPFQPTKNRSYGYGTVSFPFYYIDKRSSDYGFNAGMFEILLRSIVSTGNSSYNGTYDSFRCDLGLGISDDFVDTQSFINADKMVAQDQLSVRPDYIICDEPTSLIEIINRECLLFGFFVAINKDGKIALKSILSHEYGNYTETLSDETNAQANERLTIEKDKDNIINAMKIIVDYNCKKNEYSKFAVTVIDQNAKDTSKQQETIEFKHPGFVHTFKWRGVDEAEMSATALSQHFINSSWSKNFRYPNDTTSVTLAPTMLTRISVGDIVRFKSDHYPNPDGSGSMSVDDLAIVLNIETDFNDFVGRAKLLLFSKFKALNSFVPWSPSVKVTAWTSPYLTVNDFDYGDSSTDNEDGEAFVENDLIYIRDTHATDPSSSSKTQGPFTVDYYDSANNRLYLKSSPTITISSAREYVASYADYDEVQSSQKTTGFFCAEDDLELDGSEGQRYG